MRICKLEIGKEWWRPGSTSTATFQFPTRICTIPAAQPIRLSQTLKIAVSNERIGIAEQLKKKLTDRLALIGLNRASLPVKCPEMFLSFPEPYEPLKKLVNRLFLTAREHNI